MAAAWAGAAVELKAGRLRTLSSSRRLVARDALLAAAAAAAVTEPDLPAEEPAFAPLGAPAEVKKQLMSLWRQWRSAVEDSWDNPRKQDYLVYRLADMMGRRRKGRDHMLDRARALLAEWEVAARPAAGERHRERVLVASFPRDKVTEHASRGSFLDQLSEWELGVLAAYTIDTVWQPQPVITVQVPEPVAARLLTREDGLCFAEAETAVGGAGAAETTAERSPEAALPLGPGVFDDTPVSSRRLVTGEHLRALRATMRDAEQLYIVFSVDAGLEVVALSLLEQRCASGCHHRRCQRSACRSSEPGSPPPAGRCPRMRRSGPGIPTTRTMRRSAAVWAQRKAKGCWSGCARGAGMSTTRCGRWPWRAAWPTCAI